MPLAQFSFSEPWKFYLYIGITSLCLYNSTKSCVLQYGNLYKVHETLSCNMQKLCEMTKCLLTKDICL